MRQNLTPPQLARRFLILALAAGASALRVGLPFHRAAAAATWSPPAARRSALSSIEMAEGKALKIGVVGVTGAVGKEIIDVLHNRGFNVDELKLSGLTPMPSTKVKPPRIAESAVHMECKLKHKYEVKGYGREDTTTVVIGEVVMFHVNEAVAAKTDLRELVGKRDDARKKWLETVEACAAMLSC